MHERNYYRPSRGDFRRRALRGFVIGVIVTLVLILAGYLSLMGGCAKREASFSTGKAIAGATLPGFKGDGAYLEVSAAALPALHDNYRAVLSDLGLVKWDRRFDCNHLADLYIAAAQARHLVATWHSSTEAESLALGVVWYRRAAGGNHAIIEARTDRGVVYVDPGAGPQSVTLTPGEQASIYFRKW
jgi:hypothetical protein